MSQAPICLDNEQSATEYMTTYHYALWPVTETGSGRIVAEIREPSVHITDTHGKIYDTSPVVERAESVRLFASLMDSPVGPVFRALGYRLNTIIGPDGKSTILSIEMPSLATLTNNAANGVTFEKSQKLDATVSLTQMDIEQTTHLAEGRYSLGDTDKSVTENMILAAPCIALAPPELISGLVEMSKAAQTLEPTDEYQSQRERGRPAAILNYFSPRENLITLLCDTLKNPEGIPGVDYSPIDQLGWEINGIVTSGGGSLADEGKHFAEAMIAHANLLQGVHSESRQPV